MTAAALKPAPPLTSRAVAAWVWNHGNEKFRVCLLALTPSKDRTAAILDWHELTPATQTHLLAEICDVVAQHGAEQARRAGIAP